MKDTSNYNSDISENRDIVTLGDILENIGYKKKRYEPEIDSKLYSKLNMHRNLQSYDNLHYIHDNYEPKPILISNTVGELYPNHIKRKTKKDFGKTPQERTLDKDVTNNIEKRDFVRRILHRRRQHIYARPTEAEEYYKISKSMWPDKGLMPIKYGYQKANEEMVEEESENQGGYEEEERLLKTCEAFQPNLLDHMTDVGYASLRKEEMACKFDTIRKPAKSIDTIYNALDQPSKPLISVRHKVPKEEIPEIFFRGSNHLYEATYEPGPSKYDANYDIKYHKNNANYKMIPKKFLLKKNDKELKINPNYNLTKARSEYFKISTSDRNMEGWQMTSKNDMGPGNYEFNVPQRRLIGFRYPKENKTVALLNKMKPTK